jgi:hypothetical protein
MAAPAARSIHVAGQSTSNAGSCQPTSTTVQAALPFTMLMPWMPMMMPPWMPMFGKLLAPVGCAARSSQLGSFRDRSTRSTYFLTRVRVQRLQACFQAVKAH